MLHKVNGKSIRYRLTLGYSISMIISIIIVSIVFFTVNSRLTEEKLLKNDYASLNIFTNFLLKEIDDVKLISNNIVTSDRLIQRLDNKNYNQDYSNEMNKLIYSYDSIKSIYVVDLNKNIDAFNDTSAFEVYKDKFLNSINFDELDSLRGRISCKIGKELYLQENSIKDHIILSRAVISKNSLNVIGYLIVVISDNYINNIYNRSVQASDIQYVISDRDRNHIILPKTFDITEFESEIGKAPIGYGYIKFHGNKANYKAVGQSLDVMNGQIILLSKENDYSTGVVLLIAMIVFINIIFVAIFFNWINISILKPIDNISNWIEQILDQKELGQQLDLKSYDEINKISFALNQMMGKVNSLVDEVKNEHLLQRKL